MCNMWTYMLNTYCSDVWVCEDVQVRVMWQLSKPAYQKQVLRSIGKMCECVNVEVYLIVFLTVYVWVSESKQVRNGRRGGIILIAISLERLAWQFWKVGPDNLIVLFLLPIWENKARNTHVPIIAAVTLAPEWESQSALWEKSQHKYVRAQWEESCSLRDRTSGTGTLALSIKRPGVLPLLPIDCREINFSCA